MALVPFSFTFDAPQPGVFNGKVFDRDRLKQQCAALAAKGVFIGTSSWKYPGWRGMLYDESRYITGLPMTVDAGSMLR